MASDEPMSDARLAEIRERAERIPGSVFVKTQKELSQTFFDRNELLDEVERLRATLAAQGNLVTLIAAEAWHGHDAPYYAGIRRLMEAHKRAWHTMAATEPTDATTAERE